MAENVFFDKALDCISKEDYPQAKSLLEKAIEESCIDAYNELGQLYYHGQGVEQNYSQAFDLFQKGANAGNVFCMQNQGICFYWGQGVGSDLQKAAYYNEKAADKGLPIAMYDTGLNYERGLGVLFLVTTKGIVEPAELFLGLHDIALAQSQPTVTTQLVTEETDVTVTFAVAIVVAP